MGSSHPIIDGHDRFMTLNYPRYPIVIESGRGCRLTDADGKVYLDLFSGFGAGILGHCHPDLVDAATQQAQTLWHVGNLLHTAPQTQLAEHIATKGFGGRSYFCHSGSDANESAFKLARLYGKGDRYRIISTDNSFHGRGFAAMMATGQTKAREGFEPWIDGFNQVPFNDLDAMRRAVDDQTVAILVEPIQGEGGVNMPDDDYLPGLRALCDERDLLLICDEVWTGCGRTGRYFGYQHWPIEPDIMTLGKAVGAGLGVGVMCAVEKHADVFNAKQHGGVMHATTLGGNCVAMAVSARMFVVIERDGLIERAAALGQTITDRLNQFAKQTGLIKEIRGKGLFLGIELDPDHDDAWFDSGADVVNRCMERGLMINATQDVVLRLAPPLIVTDAEIDEGLTTLEDVLRR